jgi:predicted esterase
MERLMRGILRAIAGTVCAGAAILAPRCALADILTLKNGMTVEGSVTQVASVESDPLKPPGDGIKPIVVVDNGLTRTLFPTKQLEKFETPAVINSERIKVLQRIPASGQSVSVVGLPLRIDPFDEHGRRIFSMVGPRRTLDIVQGITEITPKWTKVEAIEGINHYIWTMRIATSSIPREQLSKILIRALDAKDPTQRLRIVRLYMQMERFDYARPELEQLIREFPDLAYLKDQVKELHRLSAERLLKEIELRREAGQYRLVTAMLEQFPIEGVPGETLLSVRDALEAIRKQQAQGHQVLALLDQHLPALKSETTRKDVERIVGEIKSELNINTLDRMADYLRLADDAKMSAEQKLSLAISGWLLGSGAAVDNLGVSLSLVKVRELVREYMLTTRQPERVNLIGQLTSQEAATNAYIAGILAHMKPPVPTEVVGPKTLDVGDPAAILALPGEAPKNEAKAAEIPAKDSESECAPKQDDAAVLAGGVRPAAGPAKSEPAATEEEPPQPRAGGTAQATGVPGLFELTVNSNLPEDPQIKYWVQLPPEYDPYRRYPCIVTLSGTGTTPLQQIDWWAGGYSQEGQTRYGQATRHGYIVIAPRWLREHQRQYEFSAREHAAVLLPLRDACKRFAIDVDRVFISGHSVGGTAAWDIALAHPDLWAGMIPIVAKPGKYISSGKYAENGKYVPMYFVCGEKDTGRFESLGDWDDYLKKIGYDVMVVEYLGRGHEAFYDEIQNLFRWMNLHRRDFHRKEFTVRSLRPWDNFFWWVETDDPRPVSVILPAEWGEGNVPGKTPRPAETETSGLAPNGLSVRNGSCGKIRVWLSPELVTFNDSLKITINGKTFRRIQPSLEIMLEDVRTRGDRQHPFWAKVEN